MAKRRRREDDSEGTTAEEEEYYTLFIDTSLETHLATIISGTASVVDVKKKIVLEHSQLFPQIGEIKILSLQVKRQGHFYHLPDSMLVVSAYVGSKRHKSLFVEASSSEHDKEQDTCEPEIKRRSSSEASDHEIVGVETAPDLAGQSAPSIVKKRQKEVSQDLISLIATSVHDKNEAAIEVHDQSNHLGSLISVANQTDGVGPMELALHSDSHVMPSGSCQPTDQNDADRINKELNVSPKVSEMGYSVETLISDGTKKKKMAKKKASKVQTSSVGEQSRTAGANSSTVPNLAAENVVNTDKNESAFPQIENDKSNIVEVEKGLSSICGLEDKLSEGFKLADHGEAEVANREMIFSADLLVPGEAMKTVHSIGTKRKKRKIEESPAKIQDKAKMEDEFNAVSGMSPLVQDVAPRNQMADNNNESTSDLHSVEMGQAAKIAGDNGNQVIMPTGSKPGHQSANGNNSVATVLTSGAKDLKSGSQLKKKKTKKSTGINQVDSCMDRKNVENGLSSVTYTPANPVMDEAINAQRTLTQDVGRTTSASMDVSISVSQREGEKVIQNDEVLLPSSDVYPNQENTAVMDENVREVVVLDQIGKPATVQPNDVQFSVLDQIGKLQENDGSIHRKEKKKRKEGKISVAEKFSISEMKEQNFSVEELVASQTLTQDVGKKTLESMEVSVSVAQREGEKVSQNQEVLVRPTDMYLNEGSAAVMDKDVREVKNNQSRENNGDPNEKPVTGQPDDVQGPILDQPGRNKENYSGVHRKEKTKRKKGKISVSENLSISEMKGQNFGVEELAASWTLAQDVGKKTSESMEVSVSVAQREGEKVIQKQEVLLPPVDVYPNKENIADVDVNVREVVKNNHSSRDDNGGSIETLVIGQPDDIHNPVLDQLGRHQEINRSVNRKAKKKGKKGQISAAENLSNLEMKEPNFGVEELAASGDVLKGLDSPSKTTKISKSTNGGTDVQSTVPHFLIEKNTETELGRARAKPAQIGTTSSEVPLVGRPETEINDESNLETTKGADEGINFRNYFVPGESQNEIGSSVKVIEALQSMKPNKKKAKRNVVTQSTLKLSETHGKGKSSDATNANDKKFEVSTDMQNKELPLSNKKISKASHDGAIVSTSRDVVGSRTRERTMKPAVASHSRDSRTAHPLLEESNGSSIAPGLSSRFKDPGEVVQNSSIAKQQPSFNHNTISTRKGSSGGNLLKSFRREKSLLTTERKLFTSSESSSDKNNMLTSDSSTQTPSENSSSSGSSTVKSDSGQDSKRKGSAKTKDGAGRNVSSNKFSGLQHMSMDMVLRSSSRFKKAKLTASQSQDADTENWTDDFVPDSQANV